MLSLFMRAAVSAIAVVSVAVGTFTAGEVRAQNIVQPPVISLVDGNGVNLASGKMQLPNLDVGIGANGSGLSRLSQAFLNDPTSTDGTADNFSGSFTLGAPIEGQTGFTYQASYGGQVFRFFVPVTSGQIGSGPYTSSDSQLEKLTCSTLDPNAVGSCTLATSDGTLVEYARSTAGAPRVMVNVVKPDNERIDFDYYIVSGVSKALKTVRSSQGWMLKYEVDGNYKVVKVTAINSAATYCDPAANACSVASSYPTVTLVTNGSTNSILRNGTTLVSYTTSGNTTTISSPSGVTKTVVLYDSSNVNAGLVYQVTAAGSTWTYSYNRVGGAVETTVTNPNGKTRTTRINSASKVTSVTDEAGRTTSYTYNTSSGATFGLLYRVINPDGSDTTGGFTQYEYDSLKRPNRVIVVPKGGASGGTINMATAMVTTSEYGNACSDDASRKYCMKPTAVIDANGVRTEYEYHLPSGQVQKITLPTVNGARPQVRNIYAQLTPFIKNSGGGMTAQSSVWKLTETSTCMVGDLNACVGGANEKRTLFTYGTSNLLLTQTTTKLGDNSLSIAATVTYNDNGQAIVADGPKPGAVDEVYSVYDALGRQTAGVSIDPDLNDSTRQRTASKTEYDSDGRARKVEVGTVPTSIYNGPTPQDRWNQAVSDLNSFSVQQTDTNQFDTSTGRTIIARHYIGAEAGTPKDLTQRTYDNMGRLTCEAVRLNSNAYGSLPASACSQGTANPDGTKDRITQYNYHPVMGILTSVTTGVGTANPRNEYVKTFDYDSTTSTGNLTAITDAKGNRTGYEYDGFNRLFKTCYPSAANGASTNASDCETTTYRATTVTGASQATALVSQVTLRDNTSTISFGYDALGRVSSKSGAIVESFTYDNFSQVTYRTNSTNGHTINGSPSTGTYSYNAHGWLLSEGQPMGTVSYQYDDYGRRIRLTYPTAGNPYVTYEYNNGDEVVAIKENGSTQLAGFSFNNSGQRTGLVRQNGQNTVYAYDASQRLQYLTQGTSGTSHYNQITYGYNPADQIASKSNNNSAYGFTPTNQSIGYTINGLNQVSQIGSSPLSHDLRGNITGDTGGTFTYNANNLMVAATQSGITTTLGYDASGRLYSVSKNSATTRFLYDGVDLIAEFDGNGTLQRRYVHGPGADEPLVQFNADGSKYFLHANEQASIILITNSSGGQVATNAYDEYGLPRAGNSGRFQYAGQSYLPEIGMYYYKARIYHPVLGRFMQTDPIGYGDGMNWYAYVHADPVNRIDPSGLDDIPTITIRGNCWDDSECAATRRARYEAMARNNQLGALYSSCGGSLSCQQTEFKKYTDYLKDKNQWMIHVAVTAPNLLTLGEGMLVSGVDDAVVLTSKLGKQIETGAISVYRSVDVTGKVQYVGISNSILRRAAEHLSSKGITIEAIPGLRNLSRADAKAVEQVLIKFYGLSKDGGTLMNKINSIAASNPGYANAIQRGEAILKAVGYPGF